MAGTLENLFSKPGSVLMDWAGPSGALEFANERLSLLAPRSSSQSWLYAYWEPGEPWMPIHRIIIAEMTPRAVMGREYAFYRSLGESGDASMFYELEGPNPRDGGHYDDVKETFLYEGLPPNITQRQWLLWRSEQAFAKPIWVVQGSHGGHKRRFSELEGVILKKHGKPRDAPHPGKLPYSAFDDRVLDALKTMSDLHWHYQVLMKFAELRTDSEQYKKRLSIAGRIESEIYAWLDPQIDEIAA